MSQTAKRMTAILVALVITFYLVGIPAPAGALIWIGGGLLTYTMGRPAVLAEFITLLCLSVVIYFQGWNGEWWLPMALLWVVTFPIIMIGAIASTVDWLLNV